MQRHVLEKDDVNLLHTHLTYRHSHLCSACTYFPHGSTLSLLHQTPYEHLNGPKGFVCLIIPRPHTSPNRWARSPRTYGDTERGACADCVSVWVCVCACVCQKHGFDISLSKLSWQVRQPVHQGRLKQAPHHAVFLSVWCMLVRICVFVWILLLQKQCCE